MKKIILFMLTGIFATTIQAQSLEQKEFCAHVANTAETVAEGRDAGDYEGGYHRIVAESGKEEFVKKMLHNMVIWVYSKPNTEPDLLKELYYQHCVGVGE